MACQSFKQMVRPYPSSSYPHPTLILPFSVTSTFYHSRLGIGLRKRLIFSANGHEGEYRLDIDPDGTVSIQTGVKCLGRALQPKSALQSESDQRVTDTRNDSIKKIILVASHRSVMFVFLALCGYLFQENPSSHRSVTMIGSASATLPLPRTA